MKTINLLLLTLAVTMAARADFSYTMTRKSAQGAAGTPVKTSIKGQKMMIDNGGTVTILDFDAQTVTTLHSAQKSYTVTKFADMGQPLSGAGITADVKETGQKKNINGFNASEMLMTIDADNPGRAGMKMEMEVHIWVSPDVPGAKELHAFYRRNAEHFPWFAMAPAANASMAGAMTELQRKLATLDGVPVLEVIRTKMGGGGAAMSAQQQAQMEQARARLEEMQKQGGQQGAMAAQALARMGSAGGSGFETTMEGGNFSTTSIPDSAFAVPAGYNRTDR